MKLALIQTFTALLCTVVAASTAHAAEPNYCDRNSDPDECACPSEGTDACVQLPLSELLDASNPAEIRDAANIETSWNGEDNVWEVHLDVSSLPGYGVIKVTEQVGTWTNLPELYAYLSELLGVELTVEPDEEGNVEFPKMHIDQRGASYRYNVDDNTWVEKNTNSLIWDLITSHDGQMEVGGKQFDVWSTEEVPAGEGKYCAGTDPLALDIEQDIQLKGWECSSGNALLEPVELTLEQCRGEDTAPPSIEGCQVAMPGARTSLETITASFEDKVLHCVAVEKRGVPIAECDPRYAIVHKRVNADLLDVDNSYFVEGSFEKSDAALPGKTNTMEVVRDHGGMDGVCADGSGDDGNFSISLFTRDGTSVPHANSCHISDLFRLLYLSGMRHSTRPTVGCAA